LTGLGGSGDVCHLTVLLFWNPGTRPFHASWAKAEGTISDSRKLQWAGLLVYAHPAVDLRETV